VEGMGAGAGCGLFSGGVFAGFADAVEGAVAREDAEGAGFAAAAGFGLDDDFGVVEAADGAAGVADHVEVFVLVVLALAVGV